MKKILVTGGAGYIGSQTVWKLFEDNFEVIVIDDLRSGHREVLPPKVKLEKIGLEDKLAVKKIFSKYQPDAVIDFAAYLAAGESMTAPEKYFQNNVANFINLLDAMVEFGCKYIIKSSTAAVYGNPRKNDDIPWSEEYTNIYQPKKSALLQGEWQSKKISGEDFLLKFLSIYQKVYSKQSALKLYNTDIFKLRIPLSIYGVSKILDEIILSKYNSIFDIKFIALRYFNVCGADPKGHTGDWKPKPTNLMALSMAQLLGQLDELTVFGNDYPTPDGSGIRDYIHPVDLAHSHIKALNFLQKEQKSEVFNLGTGKGASVFEVISAVEKIAGKKIKYKIVGRRTGDPSISIADPSKAEKILNWKAKNQLSEMARTAWEWETKFKPKIINKNENA